MNFWYAKVLQSFHVRFKLITKKSDQNYGSLNYLILQGPEIIIGRSKSISEIG